MKEILSLRTPRGRWLTGFLFWTLVGVFFSMYAYYYFSPRQPGYTFVDAMKGTLPQWYVWGLLAVFIIRLDGSLGLKNDSLLKRVLVHFPLSIFWTLLYVTVEALSDQIVYGKMRPFDLPYVAGEFQWNYPNYWIIIGAYVAYQYYNEFRVRELKASRLEAQLARAHLQSLKMQLRPHFLFNALNTISACMEKDPKTARRMAAHLGDLLRFSLEQSDKQEITLAEEIDLLQHYLEIQRIRFEDGLTITLDIAPETRDALVPTLLLQPLVENAIRHGLGQRADGGRLEIEAEKKNEKLHLSVRDNGAGLPKNWQRAVQRGVGLSNTVAMLAQLYNGEQRFEIRNAPQGGVIVEIELPYRTTFEGRSETGIGFQ